jgi:hypothetical protein
LRAARAQRRVSSVLRLHALGHELVGLTLQVVAQLLVDLFFDLTPPEQPTKVEANCVHPTHRFNSTRPSDWTIGSSTCQACYCSVCGWWP